MSDRPISDPIKECVRLGRELHSLERELNEQLLVNGKGSEREAALLAKVERLERENAVLRSYCEEKQISLAECNLDKAALREDKERLDCGCILVKEMDEMGDFISVLHKGINLRAAIDAAQKEAQP